MGFLLMGFTGYFIKLIHIPIINIMSVLSGRWRLLDVRWSYAEARGVLWHDLSIVEGPLGIASWARSLERICWRAEEF
jgi:hypothetical protein